MDRLHELVIQWADDFFEHIVTVDTWVASTEPYSKSSLHSGGTPRLQKLESQANSFSLKDHTSHVLR